VKPDSVNSDLKINYLLKLYAFLISVEKMYLSLPLPFTMVHCHIFSNQSHSTYFTNVFQSSLLVLKHFHKNWLSQQCHWC